MTVEQKTATTAQSAVETDIEHVSLNVSWTRLNQSLMINRIGSIIRSMCHISQTNPAGRGVGKKKRQRSGKSRAASGRLPIGDHWNAISIIALSQSNPLKAVAEFIENSIDANARNITVIRGREKGLSYLRITDDGNGIPPNDDGIPNFRYVATHICDSIKRYLSVTGRQGVQGEFGIGLLSFWTVGEELSLVSSGADGGREMKMAKGDPIFRPREAEAVGRTPDRLRIRATGRHRAPDGEELRCCFPWSCDPMQVNPANSHY